MEYSPPEPEDSDDRRLEENSSSQHTPWHVGRGKIGNHGPGRRGLFRRLAVSTLDPERSDVLSKIRKDFDAAGVVQSDEQMLRVLNELTLQAGGQMPSTRGGAADALTVMLARKIKPE